MGRLNFRDIQDWTPSSISVVDQPDHPLAVFEVYEDDEEFVKKSISLEENSMSEQNLEIKEDDTQMVSGPVSFFERLLSRNVVTKSTEPTEPPEKPPVKEDKSNAEKILSKLDELDKKIEGIDERVSKLEGNEDPQNEDDSQNNQGNDDPVPGTVTKSREVDPDELVVTKSEKTRLERMGRNNNGMTW